MMRPPCSTASRIHGSAFSGVPMASSMSRARLGAPPCSGPERAPMAPTTAEPRSAPVDVITRAVNACTSDGRQQRLHRVGYDAQGGDLGDEPIAFLPGRQSPLEEQVPHVFERALLTELDRVVLTVVVEALLAAHVAYRGLGHDDTG